jgi:putative FmdB family regulatory protein
MPLYEYECGKCSHRFELRRSFAEGSSASCPCCNNMATRIFAPVPIVFKGSGFYVTDYRKEKPPVESKPETKAAKTECKAEKTGACDSSGCKTCNN